MHVGLNLIFLVPGETGGMEVAARELIPALLAQAPPGTRFTAFVNREAAAAGDGPWGELLPAVTVPVNARNRVQWVLGEQPLLPRLAARAGVELVHSLASTAPLWGRFRRVVTVHDLIYARFPEAHAGIRDKGMRVLVPPGGAPLGPGDRRLAEHARRSGRAAGRRRPSAIDVVPLGLGAVRRAAPLAEREVRARFELGERRVLLSLSAKRPHKNLLALIGALARIAARAAPAARAPRLPDRARGASCARARARSASTATCASRRGLRRGARGAVGDRGRRSCSRRCTRASGCRCSRRWRAACRSPARTPPRCRRSRATRRCCSTRTMRRRSPRRSRACWTTPALRERLRARGLARASRSSPGSAPRALTLDSYAARGSVKA